MLKNKQALQKHISENVVRYISSNRRFLSESRVAVVIGFLFIMVVSIGIGYIKTRATIYGEKFYPIKFRLNYLEDIRSGANIRYKGGLIIGKVKDITIKDKHFEIDAIISKEFLIPKTASRITLKTWGYFGPKYINIDIFIKNKEHLNGLNFYKKNEIIPIEDVINITILMDKFARAIENNEDEDTSILQQKLGEIQKMVKRLRLETRRTRYNIKNDNYASKFLNAIDKFNQISRKVFGIIEEIDQFNYDVTIELNSKMPEIKESVRFWRKFTDYHEESKYYGLVHSETSYDKMLAYLKETNRKLKIYKKKPHRMMFDD